MCKSLSIVITLVTTCVFVVGCEKENQGKSVTKYTESYAANDNSIESETVGCVLSKISAANTGVQDANAAACENDKQGAPATIYSEIAASNANSLASIAAECDIKNISGTQVDFYNTELDGSGTWTAENVCGIAGEAVDRSYNESKKAIMSTFCAIADESAQAFGGGNYAAAIQRISSWDDQTRDTQNILKLLNNCESKESRFKLVSSSTPDVHIYSVGTVKWRGKQCAAYLVKVVPSKNMTSELAGSMIYELYGVGDCMELRPSTYLDKVRNSKNNPNGVPPGKYMAANLGYTGKMPDKYQYRGSEYWFSH